MTNDTHSWVRENSTLVIFLVGQMLAFGTAGASILAYMVKLETRVYIMETRGAEYTVDRMNKFDQRITIMEQRIERAAASIERIVDQFMKGQKPPLP
jgi:hypothetical protein